MNKNKIIIASVSVVLVLVGVGLFFYWNTSPQKSVTQQAAEDIQKITTDVSDNIVNKVSPDLTVPTVAVPETNVNPYKETNPFSDLKINPFK